MLNAGNSRNSSTLPFKGVIGLLWICLLSWTISSSHAVNINCCPDGQILWTLKCSNGSKISLKCPHGYYLINPNANIYDNFTIIHENDDAWLKFPDTNSEMIPSTMFCVANRGNESFQIALGCFENQYNYSGSKIWKHDLFGTLGIISTIFLIITLAIYAVLPELREIQDKAMMSAVAALAVSYLTLAIQNIRGHVDGDYIICISLGFTLYVGFMSAFFWLNIVSFNIWRTVWFKSFIIKDKALFIIYFLYGWGGPIFFLIIALVMHHVNGNHLKPGFGELSCWFDGAAQTWAYFYGPIAVLLMLNMIYLGLTGWRLWHQYRDYNGNKLRALRFKCLLYVKLFFVMGTTWIFELLSFLDASKNDIWIPTDILNALQGFIIFLLLVVMRKRVRKLLAKKRPCGFGFPKSWAACEDEECEVELPEELQLSQQG